jgi:HK97 family phage major capsid protein
LNTALESSGRTKLAAAEADYRDLLNGVERRIAALPDTASPTDVNQIEAEARAQLDAAEARVEEARKQLDSAERISQAREGVKHLIPTGDVRVVSEQRTYGRDSQHSFFADLYAVQKTGSPAAMERLQRNNREAAGIESRATLTTTDFYAPQFLADQWVPTYRPRLVFGGLVKQLNLPPYGETISIPKYTGPATAATFQAGDNAALTSNAGSTSQLTTAICLAAGYADVARQAVERATPGLDEVIFGDISRDIAHQIEVGCLNGSGTNQPLGILNDSNVPSVSVSAQTAAQLLLKLADLMQRVEVAVGEPANFILCHSRRFAWLASLLDSSGRPLIVPAGQGPYNSFGTVSVQGEDDGLSLAPDVTPMGYMLGLPIYTSPSIPTTSGSGTNEDWILTGVSDLAVRWADPQGIRHFAFEAVASSTASIRLQALTYSAYIHRVPTAFGIVKGLTTPSF